MGVQKEFKEFGTPSDLGWVEVEHADGRTVEVLELRGESQCVRGVLVRTDVFLCGAWASSTTFVPEMTLNDFLVMAVKRRKLEKKGALL